MVDAEVLMYNIVEDVFYAVFKKFYEN
jgi:hypothetical protein